MQRYLLALTLVLLLTLTLITPLAHATTTYSYTTTELNDIGATELQYINFSSSVRAPRSIIVNFTDFNEDNTYLLGVYFNNTLDATQPTLALCLLSSGGEGFTYMVAITKSDATILDLETWSEDYANYNYTVRIEGTTIHVEEGLNVVDLNVTDEDAEFNATAISWNRIFVVAGLLDGNLTAGTLNIILPTEPIDYTPFLAIIPVFLLMGLLIPLLSRRKRH